MKLLYVTRRIRRLKHIVFKIFLMNKQHSIRHGLHLYVNIIRRKNGCAFFCFSSVTFDSIGHRS